MDLINKQSGFCEVIEYTYDNYYDYLNHSWSMKDDGYNIICSNSLKSLVKYIRWA